MNENTSVKMELAVIAFLKTLIPTGLKFFPGHGLGDVEGFPRCIVTCAEGSELCAGVDEVPCEIQLLGRGKKGKPSDPAPVALGGFVNMIRAGLSDTDINETTGATGLEAFLEFVNKPDGAPDLREVKGFGMSGMSFEGFAEGRDEEHNLQGILLRYRGWAHLEE